MQAKAKNTKTISAVEAWVKAINLYHADTGNWPTNSCLGNSTTYDGDGACWLSSPWLVQSSFLAQVQPYIGGSSVPEPDTTDIYPSGGPQRGAFYYNHSTLGPMIWFMQVGVSSCPNIGGLSYHAKGTSTNGIYCEMQFTSQ